MTTATPWRLQGDILEVCSCNVACPCNFGGDPTQVPCDAAWGLHISQGNYGGTQLNDLNVVLFFRIPGKPWDGNFTVGGYLDQKATPQQVQALGAVLSGEAGGFFGALKGLIGQMYPPSQAAIQLERTGEDIRVTVPERVEIGSEAIPNPMGEPPMATKVSGLALPIFGPDTNIRRSAVMKVSDPNLSFEYRGTSSLTSRFDLQGP